MQPLKRFTQCGSITMLFVVFIVLFGVSSTALTTFGKANTNSGNTYTPPVKGNECKSQTDCSGIKATSCVRDLEDNKLRCLCGNNEAPDNGYCNAKIKKGLHHMCKDSDECRLEMICGADNSTKTTGFNSRATNNIASKICLCDESIGYVEDDDRCNGAITLVTGVFIPLSSLIIGSLLARKSIN